jgi:hypothetical protein
MINKRVGLEVRLHSTEKQLFAGAIQANPHFPCNAEFARIESPKLRCLLFAKPCTKPFNASSKKLD